MASIPFLLPVLAFSIILGLQVYLLMRGIAHWFVGLFAAGSFLHLLQGVGFLVLQQAPGGISAHAGYLPILSGLGMLGGLVSLAGFIALALFLLQREEPVT